MKLPVPVVVAKGKLPVYSKIYINGWKIEYIHESVYFGRISTNDVGKGRENLM